MPQFFPFTIATLFCGLVGGCWGCAKSPILNHRDEVAVQKTEKACAVQTTRLHACVDVNWKTPLSTESELALEIHLPEPTARLNSAVAWMPKMSHPSRPTHIQPLGNAHFLVDKIFLFMNGEWDLKFGVTLDGIVDDFTLVVNL